MKGGKRVGELEMYLKGGDSKSLADLEMDEKKAEMEKTTAQAENKPEPRTSGHV